MTVALIHLRYLLSDLSGLYRDSCVHIVNQFFHISQHPDIRQIDLLSG